MMTRDFEINAQIQRHICHCERVHINVLKTLSSVEVATLSAKLLYVCILFFISISFVTIQMEFNYVENHIWHIHY